MENAASRVHSHLQLNHTKSTQELKLSIRLVNLCKHAQISKHQRTLSVTATCLLLHQHFKHFFIPGALASFCVCLCVCVCVCACVANTALLHFYDDVRLTKNLYDEGSAIFHTTTISIKPERCPDFEKYDIRGTRFHFFLHISCLVTMFRLCNYPIMYKDIFYPSWCLDLSLTKP